VGVRAVADTLEGREGHAWEEEPQDEIESQREINAVEIECRYSLPNDGGHAEVAGEEAGTGESVAQEGNVQIGWQTSQRRTRRVLNCTCWVEQP
jgi:hypothetical protein